MRALLGAAWVDDHLLVAWAAGIHACAFIDPSCFVYTNHVPGMPVVKCVAFTGLP